MESMEVQNFTLQNEFPYLDKVFTLGFPNIPLAEAGVVGHLGEVNGFVKVIEETTELILISNLVSPGSSGGPVINRYGLCVGMSTNWLEGEWQGQKARFSRAIPAGDIINTYDHNMIRHASTKLSSTLFDPALSNSTSSLFPSMAMISPLPNFWWKTRWPTDRSLRARWPTVTLMGLVSIWWVPRGALSIAAARCQPGPLVPQRSTLAKGSTRRGRRATGLRRRTWWFPVRSDPRAVRRRTAEGCQFPWPARALAYRKGSAGQAALVIRKILTSRGVRPSRTRCRFS